MTPPKIRGGGHRRGVHFGGEPPARCYRQEPHGAPAGLTETCGDNFSAFIFGFLL